MAWAVLGSTKLSSTADTITVDSLPVRKHLVVQVKGIASGNLDMCYLRFNNDSGSNYTAQKANNGGSMDANNSITGILYQTGNAAYNHLATFNIVNVAAKEKLVIAKLAETASGAGNAPNRKEVTGKWANTSDAITRVDVVNTGGAGDFAVDSEVIVWGDESTDAAETFIENSTIFEETDTGKHRIWNSTTSAWTEIA